MTVTIKLEFDVFSPGQWIEALIRFHAPERAILLESVSLALCSEEERGSRVLAEKVNQLNGRPIAPRQETSVGLELEIPADIPVDERASFRLVATAQAPGFRAEGSIAIRLTPAEASADEDELPDIERWSDKGLLPIFASFDPHLFSAHFRPDAELWVPKYEETSFETAQTFSKADLTPRLIEVLKRRVVFLQTRFDKSFGVLNHYTIDGGTRLQVLYIAPSGSSVRSETPLEEVESLGLARFTRPGLEELTYDVIGETREFDARMKGEPFDSAAFKRQVEELRAITP